MSSRGCRRSSLGTTRMAVSSPGLFRDAGCLTVSKMDCVIWVWEIEIRFKSCKEAGRKIEVQGLGQKRLKCFCGFGRLRTCFVLIEFAPKFVYQWYMNHETHLWSVWISWEGTKCILPAVILFGVCACSGCGEGLWVMTAERGHFEPLVTSAASQECVRELIIVFNCNSIVPEQK